MAAIVRPSRRDPQPGLSVDRNSADDIEIVCQTDAAPHIPPGTYEVAFVKAMKSDFKMRPLLYLTFEVCAPDQYRGVCLLLVCNIRQGRFTESCKYWQAWCLASGRRPIRGDRMSTNIFKNKRYLARVRDVVTTWQQAPRPEHLRYSVIDCLLKRTAGG